MQMKWVGHKFKTDQGRLLKHGTFLHRVLGKIKACALKPSKLYSAQFKPDKKRKQQKTKTNESFQPCTPVKVKNSALNTPLNPGNYNPTTKTLQPVLAFLATPPPPPQASHSPYPSCNCRCHDLLPPTTTEQRNCTQSKLKRLHI